MPRHPAEDVPVLPSVTMLLDSVLIQGPIKMEKYRVRNVARWDSRLMISLEEGISLETAFPANF